MFDVTQLLTRSDANAFDAAALIDGDIDDNTARMHVFYHRLLQHHRRTATSKQHRADDQVGFKTQSFDNFRRGQMRADGRILLLQ